MKTKLVAPCGINCGACRAYLREKNSCPGCRGAAGEVFAYCADCAIRNCEHFAGTKEKYCHSCPEFPCKRLRQLDKRYRGKYRMSVIENLEIIRDRGIRRFVAGEKERWACAACGEIVSCHHVKCGHCGAAVT